MNKFDGKINLLRKRRFLEPTITTKFTYLLPFG